MMSGERQRSINDIQYLHLDFRLLNNRGTNSLWRHFDIEQLIKESVLLHVICEDVSYSMY